MSLTWQILAIISVSRTIHRANNICQFLQWWIKCCLSFCPCLHILRTRPPRQTSLQNLLVFFLNISFHTLPSSCATPSDPLSNGLMPICPSTAPCVLDSSIHSMKKKDFRVGWAWIRISVLTLASYSTGLPGGLL